MSNQKHNPAEIQEAIKQGPITQEYKADAQKIVRALNQLRTTEITSYLQYMQHAYMAVSLVSPGLKNDFQSHATQELAHADRLALRIQQLGGVPIYDLEEMARRAAGAGVHAEQGATLTEMVAQDLMLERQQITAYTSLIREIDDQDLVTRQILIGILDETERHASELADYLTRTAQTR